MTDLTDVYIDQALAALGSDDAEFTARACMRDYGSGPRPAIAVSCEITGCGWGFTIGEMEVWEITTDCREHWQAAHGTAP